MNTTKGTDGTSVTISFHGGALVPGLPKTVTQELDEAVTVAALIDRLEPVVGIPDLRAKVAKYYAIVIDGASIQHLQG